MTKHKRLVECFDQWNDQTCAECKIESPTLNMLLIASLNGIEIDKIVQAICNCYESDLRLVKISDRVNKLYEQFVKSKESEVIVERSTTSAHDNEVAAMDIAVQSQKLKDHIEKHVKNINK